MVYFMGREKTELHFKLVRLRSHHLHQKHSFVDITLKDCKITSKHIQVKLHQRETTKLINVYCHTYLHVGRELVKEDYKQPCKDVTNSKTEDRSRLSTQLVISQNITLRKSRKHRHACRDGQRSPNQLKRKHSQLSLTKTSSGSLSPSCLKNVRYSKPETQAQR